VRVLFAAGFGDFFCFDFDLITVPRRQNYGTVGVLEPKPALAAQPVTFLEPFAHLAAKRAHTKQKNSEENQFGKWHAHCSSRY
jgi:hypothetical protein